MHAETKGGSSKAEPPSLFDDRNVSENEILKSTTKELLVTFKAI